LSGLAELPVSSPPSVVLLLPPSSPSLTSVSSPRGPKNVGSPFPRRRVYFLPSRHSGRFAAIPFPISFLRKRGGGAGHGHAVSFLAAQSLHRDAIRAIRENERAKASEDFHGAGRITRDLAENDTGRAGFLRIRDLLYALPFARASGIA